MHRVLSYQLLWPLTRLLLDQMGSRSQREVDPPRIQMDHQRNEAAQGKMQAKELMRIPLLSNLQWLPLQCLLSRFKRWGMGLVRSLHTKIIR